jgi:glycerophosphoryl diester phosphodiesterase
MWGSSSACGWISRSRDGRCVDTRASPASGTLPPVIPVARNHPYLAASRPRAFAHRGWHVGDLAGLENTLAAFSRARDEGYSYVETDVHATRDGVLVVHHDATLRRVAGHPGVLRTMDWADVDPVRVRGREKLPRLEEALEALPGMRFNVDLKSAGTLRPMLELLERDDVAERVAVACTEEGRLRAVRQRFGDRVVTGVSARAALSLRARSVLPGVLSRLVRVGGDLAQLPVRFGGLPVVDATSLRAAHAMGVEMHVWTVDRASEMHRLLDLGVDGIMTDRPDLLREVLIVRGAWESAPPAV